MVQFSLAFVKFLWQLFNGLTVISGSYDKPVSCMQKIYLDLYRFVHLYINKRNDGAVSDKSYLYLLVNYLLAY